MNDDNIQENSDSSKKQIVFCPRCDFKMISIQSCHLRCNNCGAELTCSDKGYYW